jgi:prepilin-type N-terminal cleavage/methylation domain-containing protein/prepilin-type processing-associated H-X9-DG protein
MRASREPVSSAPSRRGGFTLVELLVAISIIAVLIGMLVPTLAGARRSAWGAVCLANLRQHGVAWLGYVQDNRYFPFDRSSDFAKDDRVTHQWDWGGVNWIDEDDLQGSGVPVGTSTYLYSSRPLNPYYDLPKFNTRETPAFHCPADDGLKYGPELPYFSEDDVKHHSDASDKSTVYGVRGSSYLANEWIWVQPGSRGGFGGSTRNPESSLYAKGFTDKNSLVDVTDPSRFIVVGDAGPFQAGRMGDDRFQIVFKDGVRYNGSWFYSWWHGNQRGQMAFLDGSARAVEIAPKRGSTSAYMWWMNPGLHLLDDGSATNAVAPGLGWDPRSYGSSGEEDDD